MFKFYDALLVGLHRGSTQYKVHVYNRDFLVQEHAASDRYHIEAGRGMLKPVDAEDASH